MKDESAEEQVQNEIVEILQEGPDLGHDSQSENLPKQIQDINMEIS